MSSAAPRTPVRPSLLLPPADDLSFSVTDDSVLFSATPARGGPSRAPCRTAPSLRRSAVLPYLASAPARCTVWDGRTLGVPRQRPTLVIFGFPLGERGALLRMLERDYDVAPAAVAPAGPRCAYVVVRPATQQAALTLATLHGTRHRAADGCEYYLGVLERPDLDATAPSADATPRSAKSAAVVSRTPAPAGLWARCAQWCGLGANADAGKSAYQKVQRNSVASVLSSFTTALAEIFGTRAP